MAKKTRRARLSATQRYVPTPGAPTPDQPSAPAARPAPAPRPTQTVSRLGQNLEVYTHIRADLQRIAILAGGILAFLAVLRLFVIR
jgi:hypothetical protein